MSTWISKAGVNKARCFAVMTLLGACQTGPGIFAQPGQSRSIVVLAGAIKVAAPQGYCVNTPPFREATDGAVVLIGRCSAASDVVPAVITVTIGAAGSAGVVANGSAGLVAFFRSPAGRAALSRTGSAETLTFVQTAIVGDSLLLRIAEGDNNDYWRAVLGLSGRLVTVAVQGAEGDTPDPSVG